MTHKSTYKNHIMYPINSITNSLFNATVIIAIVKQFH